VHPIRALRPRARQRAPMPRLPHRRKAVVEAVSLLLAAASIGALVWYASTSRGGRSELASTSALAGEVRSATGAGQRPGGANTPLRRCTRPAFSSAARYGIWSKGAYNVFNNIWNEPSPPASGPGSQRIYVCNYSSWYVVADMPAPGQPASSVKSYPNVQENFSSVPLQRFSKLTSTFAASGPSTGDYEFAYDTWLNGVASNGSNEVMIWNYDHGQTPAGSPEAEVSFAGVKYTVWKTAGNGYIAFVAGSNFASGQVDLLSFYDWLIDRGWLPQRSVLDQVDYGVEICSTGGRPATFSFTNFSLQARH